MVYGDLVLAGVVLTDTSQEGLGEVETRDPEYDGHPAEDPVLRERTGIMCRC